MKFFRTISVLVIFAALVFTSAPQISLAQNEEPVKVLILLSYHPGQPQTMEVLNGIYAEFSQQNIIAEFCVEYMDTKRNDPDEVVPELVDLYKTKFQNKKFDIIIVSDDIGVSFVLQNHEILFPDTPIVFCGLNNYHEKTFENYENITGVVENVDIAGTLDLALIQHPRTDIVAVISDDTVTDESNRQHLEVLKKDYENRVEFIDFVGLSEDELIQEMTYLPEQTIILLFNYVRDSQNHFYSLEKAIDLIVSRSEFPVYSMWKDKIRMGAFGGIIIDSESHGRAAAQLAIRIINGENADSIPILMENQHIPMFNYSQLERFNISTWNLPNGSVIFDEPDTFWYKNRKLIVGSVVLLSIQALVLFLLWFNYRSRRIIEKELKENEENLRITLNSIGDAVIATDINGCITRMNPVAEQLTGWMLAEVKGKHLDDVFNIVNAVTGEKLESPVDKVLENGEVVGLANHTMLISKNGDEFQIADSGAPIRDAKNEINGVVLVFRDVSEEYELRERVFKNEERLDLAMMVANDGMWDWDIGTNTTYFDPHYFKMAGYDVDEFPHTFENWAERVHSDDVEEAQGIIQAHVAGEIPKFDLTFRFKRKDDSWMWIRGRGSIVERDSEGNPTRMVGMHTDITLQKLAEEELRIKDFVVHSAATAIITTNLDGFIKFVNPAFLEKFGLEEASEPLGKHFKNYIPLGELQDLISGELISGSGAWKGELSGFRKDGSEFPLFVSVAVMYDSQGNQIGLVGTAADITKRKQAEEALEKRIVSLTRPLEMVESIGFDELFNIEDIQRLQDEFAAATGVASLITHPDGTPITRPSRFCRLCTQLIRTTEKGRINCYRSDAKLGRIVPDGYTLEPCMSGGLWDAGTSILVGGKHIASWLIGQVRDETQKEETIRAYSREIEADEEEMVKAFYEVPSMSLDQFEKIAQAMHTLAQQLSNIAYQNVQQARFIADRKQIEAEMRQLRNYLSNIINSMPSVLVGVDMDGKVTQWNSEACRLTGISSESALGQPLTEAFPRFKSEMNSIFKAIKSRQTVVSPGQAHHDGSETHYEDVTIYPLVANGIEGAVIRIDDVTERVRIEEMIVQSQKMLSVGGLAAGMAHEINNPLAGMMQTANVLSNRLLSNPNLPANLRAAEDAGTTMEVITKFMQARDVPRMLEAVTESGKRVVSIIDNMLSFARKGETSMSTYSIEELMDRTVELAATDYDLKKHYDFKKILIKRKYVSNPPMLRCEGGKIQQVLLNILRNGAEAMQEAGVDEPCFTLRTSYDEKREIVRLEIEDNGPGMEEEIRKRVFEPFYTTKPVGLGTGLGLSVSYFIIVENHGGNISVESNLGEGAKFIIELPLDKKKD